MVFLSTTTFMEGINMSEFPEIFPLDEARAIARQRYLHDG